MAPSGVPRGPVTFLPFQFPGGGAFLFVSSFHERGGSFHYLLRRRRQGQDSVGQEKVNQKCESQLREGLQNPFRLLGE